MRRTARPKRQLPAGGILKLAAKYEAEGREAETNPAIDGRAAYREAADLYDEVGRYDDAERCRSMAQATR
jgi:hypothetical protein